MKDTFEQKLMEMAQKEKERVPALPENFDRDVEKMLRRLPERRRKHRNWKTVLVLAAALAAMLSVTVTAAVNYVSQRMAAMNEEEKLSYYQAAQNTALADFYSRELTEGEEKRMESLRQAYQNEGIFPQGELKIIEKASEYEGSGVACLASRSTYFLPETELIDEEILQIIDFMEKREYSLQDTRQKVEEGSLDRLEVPGLAEASVELEAGDLEIVCSGTRAEFAAASAKEVYFGEERLEWNGNQAAIYRLDAGKKALVKMDVQVPENLSPHKMTTDLQGNLCILLSDRERSRSVLWKISPECQQLAQIDVTDLCGSRMGYQALAVDNQGRYFLTELRAGKKEQTILILDQNGSLIHKIDYPNGDIRGLGRGRNGQVYGVLMDGDDWNPAVVGFDVEKGEIAEKWEGVLPAGMGAYDVVSPGMDSDLLIWGPAGVYSYNLGDEKAVIKKAQYELPAGGVLCILPDERAVFVEDDVILNEDGTDIADIVNRKIYLIQTD